jgi:hypothetical protein
VSVPSSQTQSSETSAFNAQTPGKYPEDYFSLLQHGESLKTRKKYIPEKKYPFCGGAVEIFLRTKHNLLSVGEI